MGWKAKVKIEEYKYLQNKKISGYALEEISTKLGVEIIKKKYT